MIKILAITFEFIFSGDSRNYAFHITTTYKWHLWIFSINETPVGEIESFIKGSFTDDASPSLFMSTTF